MSKPGEPVPLPDGTPRDTDALHETLQFHIKDCPVCREAIAETGPRAFGQRSKMCGEYFALVEYFSKGVEL